MRESTLTLDAAPVAVQTTTLALSRQARTALRSSFFSWRCSVQSSWRSFRPVHWSHRFNWEPPWFCPTVWWGEKSPYLWTWIFFLTLDPSLFEYLVQGQLNRFLEQYCTCKEYDQGDISILNNDRIQKKMESTRNTTKLSNFLYKYKKYKPIKWII